MNTARCHGGLLRAMATMLVAAAVMGSGRALEAGDYRRPAADQAPFFMEEVELSRSQRDDLSVALVALAEALRGSRAERTEALMALALAEQVDSELPSLALAWRELGAGGAEASDGEAGLDVPSSGTGIFGQLELIEALRLPLTTAQSTAQSQSLAEYLQDLILRCRAVLAGDEPPALLADWRVFFREGLGAAQPAVAPAVSPATPDEVESAFFPTEAAPQVPPETQRTQP